MKKFFQSRKRKLKAFLGRMKKAYNYEQLLAKELGGFKVEREIEIIRRFQKEGAVMFLSNKQNKYFTFVEEFNWIKNMWIDSIICQMINNFKLPESYENSVKTGDNINELLKCLNKNELIMKFYIKKALTFFGENFLEVKLKLNDEVRINNITENTVTIRQVIETNTLDWTTINIKHGCPIPLFHQSYNDSLIELCRKYVESKL